MDDNIEKFNFLVGILFARLYETFPLQEKIHFMELNEKYNFSFANDCSFEYCAVEWLEKSGYIWIYDKQNTSVVANLTPKGLELLKLVPDSIISNEDESKNSGDILKSMLKDGATEVVKANVLKLSNYLISEGSRLLPHIQI